MFIMVTVKNKSSKQNLFYQLTQPYAVSRAGLNQIDSDSIMLK
jgi:hypothetical protein